MLHEVSVVLSGEPHRPPGSIAPWMVVGGKEACACARRGNSAALATMVVGVGGDAVRRVRKPAEIRGARRKGSSTNGQLGFVSTRIYVHIISLGAGLARG